MQMESNVIQMLGLEDEVCAGRRGGGKRKGRKIKLNITRKAPTFNAQHMYIQKLLKKDERK
jgi:hypothetical protein